MHHPVRAVLAAVLILVAAACDPGRSPTEEPVAIGGRVVANGFVLEVRLPTQTFDPTDAIPVTTTLTWTGAPGGGRIWGSGSGPVTFTFTEVGGAGRMMGGAMTADCAMKEFASGVPTEVPLSKSGSWTAEDPSGPFYQAWFMDPLLHLPTGRWQVSVALGGYLAPCAVDAKALQAVVGPIEIVVR